MKTKSILIVAMFFIYSIPVFSINQYNAGDSLFVWAKSGLSLRIAPNADSGKIKVLPFGALVIPQSDKWLTMLDDNPDHILETNQFKVTNKLFKGVKIYGTWVKVTIGEIEGYVFDGYLSTMISPNSDDQYGFLEYLKRTLKVSEIMEKTSEGEVGENRLVFEGGIFYRDNVGEGAFDFQIVFSDLSFEEGFLITNYFFGEEIKVTRPDKNTVSFEDEMGGVTVNYFNRTIILSGGWSC